MGLARAAWLQGSMNLTPLPKRRKAVVKRESCFPKTDATRALGVGPAHPLKTVRSARTAPSPRAAATAGEAASGVQRSRRLGAQEEARLQVSMVTVTAAPLWFCAGFLGL